MLRTYPSRIDPLFGLLLLIAPLLGVTLLVVFGREAFPGFPPGVALSLRALLFLVLAFPVWTLVGTWYALDAHALYVRSGPFRWTIRLRDIHQVTPVRDHLRSSPALSFERLLIEYAAGRSLLISPREQELFLRDLQHHMAALRSSAENTRS